METIILLLIGLVSIGIAMYTYIKSDKKNLMKMLIGSIAIALVFTWGLSGAIEKPNESTEMTIRATESQNEQSEGNEIWVKGVQIDGRWYNADTLFEGTWIKKEGSMGWRNYDKPKDLSNSVTGAIPVGNERKVIFESNKWRGIADIEIQGVKKQVDAYNEADGEVVFELEPLVVEPSSSNIKMLINVFCILLGLSFTMLVRGNKKKNEGFNNDVQEVLAGINTRYVYSDLLKIISAFTVVFLHTTCNIYNQFSPEWNKQLVINTLTTFAVPCFMLISGAFLLNKEEENIGVFYKKRLPKIIIPTLFWSIIFILFRAMILGEELSIKAALFEMIYKEQYWHLWFMYPLITLYIISPILQMLYKRTNDREKIYIISVVFVLPGLILTVVTTMMKWIPMSQLFWGFPWLGYFFLGAVLTAIPVSKYIEKRKWIIVGLIGSYYLLFVCTYVISQVAKQPRKDFFGGDKLPVMLFAISVFCLMYSYEGRLQKISQKMKKIIATVASVSMGIYFVHPLVMHFVGNIKILGIEFTNNQGSIVSMFLGAVVYFIVSFVICYIASKIPVLKKLVG